MDQLLIRLVLAVVLAGSVAAASAESIDDLYAAAKNEGVLSLNGGGPAGLYEPWVREFEQRFPGIKVELTADFSNILAPIIDQEIRDKKLTVDLTVFQTLQDYDRWKKQGVLLTFKPEGWDQIHPSFKDERDGQYVGVAVYGLSYAYNTQSVPQTQVPKSARDFLKPEFKGKSITTYPNDDDVTLYLFYTIVQKYGWEFMDKYMANSPQWVRGHLGSARAVANGQAAVTFDTMENVSLGMKKNQSTDIAFSNVDPLPIWPQTTAIFKDAPHPNAAKLYITWFLAKEQQSRIGTWSVRQDVPPPADLKPIFDYQLANDFRSFITNDKLVEDLRKRFEGYIGKPQGQPVIR
jgi:ABC-type Fe3+ transport system substrate-binding protein